MEVSARPACIFVRPGQESLFIPDRTDAQLPVVFDSCVARRGVIPVRTLAPERTPEGTRGDGYGRFPAACSSVRYGPRNPAGPRELTDVESFDSE